MKLADAGEILGLTSYPRGRIVGSNVYPRRQGTAGTAPGHTGPAHPAHADFWAASRPRYRAGHPTDLGRRTSRRAWRPLPRIAAAGGARLDLREVGNFLQQPQGAVLFPHRCGPQATWQRNEQVEAAGGGNRTDSGVGGRLAHVL